MKFYEMIDFRGVRRRRPLSLCVPADHIHEVLDPPPDRVKPSVRIDIPMKEEVCLPPKGLIVSTWFDARQKRLYERIFTGLPRREWRTARIPRPCSERLPSTLGEGYPPSMDRRAFEREEEDGFR